jgi:cellulose synthase/poly-beta-1,6-N-acetylglucosamine synthase-like glycosyltransferase
VPLEIIVVDDKSEDRTGEILKGLKVEIPSLRTLRVDALPDDWLGKPHALACGAKIASADWLLFTDADAVHNPGSLADLLERAEKERVDLLSLSPGQLTPTWWEKAIIPLVYVWLAKLYSFDEVNDPKSGVAAANGQYLLMRRAVYERVGGHEAVRAEILEDVALARRVKAAGGRLLFLPGAPWVHTRMYRTFSEMWEGWTKNLYLLYGGNVKLILGAIATTLLVDWMPIVFLFVPVPLRREFASQSGVFLVWLYYFALIGIFALQYRLYRRRLLALDFHPALANYYWVGSALFGALLLNSLRAHLWSGRVLWKGRAYSTKGARAG